MSACPTPDKARYPDESRARRGARMLARGVIRDGQHFDPCYGYVCPCGTWHLTRRPSWDGVAHVLLWEIDDTLQEWATHARD